MPSRPVHFEPDGRPSRRPRAWLFAVLWSASAAFFAWGVPAEPSFPDETAYLTQTYFTDKLVTADERNDWAWVEYHAYDLPPLPKYVFGAAAKLAGYRLPDRHAAGLWFQNITRPLVSREMILTARWPVAVLGGLGVGLLYVLGTLAVSERVGVLAAGLLVLNPLFRLHARRAMSDVPAETFSLLAECAGLAAWRSLAALRNGGAWRLIGLFLLCGVGAGLATLSKLTGATAVLALGAWSVLALFVGRGRLADRLSFTWGLVLSGSMALALWVVLNPFLTARPVGRPPADLISPAPAREPIQGRVARMLNHRMEVSRLSQLNPVLRHDALPRPADRALAVAVQGFGRFGALGRWDHDSTHPYPRFAWDRDAGALLWLPCVVAGCLALARLGRSRLDRGDAPTEWAACLLVAVSLGTVCCFLPMAWDRYYLPFQAPAALAGAAFLVQAASCLVRPREGPGGAA